MESKSSYLFGTVSLEQRQDIWNDIKKAADAYIRYIYSI